MTLNIVLPVSARELETRLHSFCDHHGAWNHMVNIGVFTDCPDGNKVMGIRISDDDEGNATAPDNDRNNHNV